MGALKVLGLVVLVVVALGVMAMIVVKPTGRGDAVNAAQQAVQDCRKERDDPLATIAQRRLMADVCRQMEADFRDKYGYAP